MKVRTEHIKDAVRAYHFTEEAVSFPLLTEMEANGECRFSGPVVVAVHAGKEHDHYRIEGQVDVPVQLECCRCLNLFEKQIASRFTIFFREGTTSHEEEDEVELAEFDLVSTCFSGDEIDLAPEIAEQVALEIPLKPLCSESCKGLCSICGVDLNTATCSCSTVARQSKFDALKDFKVRL